MASMNNSILINETNHGLQKVGLLFDVGSFQGFGIALAISTCHWVAFGGFIIALYRLLCLKGRQVEVQSMLKIGLIYLIFFVINLVQIMNEFGWEMTLFYNFCIGKSKFSEQVENQLLTTSFFNKIIGARAIIMGQILVSSEFGIYMYIMYCLWKHDENYFQSEIITNRMLKTRKEYHHNQRTNVYFLCGNWHHLVSNFSKFVWRNFT